MVHAMVGPPKHLEHPEDPAVHAWLSRRSSFVFLLRVETDRHTISYSSSITPVVHLMKKGVLYDISSPTAHTPLVYPHKFSSHNLPYENVDYENSSLSFCLFANQIIYTT